MFCLCVLFYSGFLNKSICFLEEERMFGVKWFGTCRVTGKRWVGNPWSEYSVWKDLLSIKIIKSLSTTCIYVLILYQDASVCREANPSFLILLTTKPQFQEISCYITMSKFSPWTGSRILELYLLFILFACLKANH